MNGPSMDLCSGNGTAMLPFGAIQYLASNSPLILNFEYIPESIVT